MTHDELVKAGHALSQGGFRTIGTEIIFDNGYVPTEQELETALLEALKQEKLAEIDSEYEARRQSYLTAGATMAMVYSLKAEEAARYTENPIEDSSLYPFLSSSIQAGEASSLLEAASLVLSKRAELIGLAAQLEAERLAKKIAVNSATKLKDIKGE